MSGKPPCSGRKDVSGTRSPFTVRTHIISGHIYGKDVMLKWPEHALHQPPSTNHQDKLLKISCGQMTDYTTELFIVLSDLQTIFRQDSSKSNRTNIMQFRMAVFQKTDRYFYRTTRSSSNLNPYLSAYRNDDRST